jgi:hypothetical protein
MATIEQTWSLEGKVAVVTGSGMHQAMTIQRIFKILTFYRPWYWKGDGH